MYIHPKGQLHPAHKRSATVCVPVLLMSFGNDMYGLTNRCPATYKRFLSSRLPKLVLMVEFIRLAFNE
jgi:hypothetical protein